MTEDIIQPLVNFEEKGGPNRLRKTMHPKESEIIDHLCRLLTEDLLKRERS